MAWDVYVGGPLAAFGAIFNDEWVGERLVLGGGNSKIFHFLPLFGEDEPNLTSIFFLKGLVQPPTRVSWEQHILGVRFQEVYENNSGKVLEVILLINM